MNVFVLNTKEDILKKVCNPAVLGSISLRLRRHGPLAKRLMHISGSTSGVSKSSSDWLNYAGFPGDVCVVFFNVPPGNKDAVTPSRKKNAVVFTNVTPNAYQSQLNTGFPKVCEILKVYTIESLKYTREFHTHRSVIVPTFPRPET